MRLQIQMQELIKTSTVFFVKSAEFSYAVQKVFYCFHMHDRVSGQCLDAAAHTDSLTRAFTGCKMDVDKRSCQNLN